MAVFPSLSLFLLIAVSFDVTTRVCASNSKPKTSTEFLMSSCKKTEYPRLCLLTLSSRKDVIQTSPRVLAHEALTVTLTQMKSTSSSMVQLSKGSGARKQGVAGAMADCMEELRDAMEEIRDSVREIDGVRRSNFEVVASDVQTWVSAALTDETTCMDGFEGMKGKEKEEVRRKVEVIARLTSNALALVNSYVSAHHV